MKLILIANRGEIALRIMRTAHAMGYRAMAVFSDADALAPHVRAADCACRIGGGPAAESYLNGEAILAAAMRHGADAIHPGYGFLAENADFAQAVSDAGLTWIGPPAAAMRAMGNKATAKRLLAGREVPLLPGYQGEHQDQATLLAEAQHIGFPLMIKAAAGGGGRGMRLVQDANSLHANLAQARSEAQQAFGSGELILERALINPRHVEVQVFADAHGNVVHLGERDCSVQRRHQKIIEETPSPAVTPSLRHRLGRAALEATRSCGYVGAGTIEFLLDTDGAFWFMEMNTRLQVEHPVTEAITGVDLVEWQLRVANGERLPLSQEQIDARLLAGGHAIEVRLCAEDPARGFLPQTGTIALWQAPAGMRVEHALESGQQVSPYYDSMVAKLIASGPTRERAVCNMLAQLDQCILLGVPTNQDFLLDVLAHPAFMAGHATTGFIGEHFSELVHKIDGALVQIMACAILLESRRQKTLQAYVPELRGWSSSAPLENTLHVELDGASHVLFVEARGIDKWSIRAGAESFDVSIMAAPENRLYISIGSDVHVVQFCVDDARILFRSGHRNHCLRDLTYCAPIAGGTDAVDGMLRAPMNGRVVALAVAPGQPVQAGQTLVVLEAMKMEHGMPAPFDGLLQSVHVAIGEQVAPGQILLEIARI
jgi:geranyl-CoA carboxylase alpha subunit